MKYSGLSDFVKDLELTIVMLDAYLSDRRAGKSGEGTVVQLEALRDYFASIAQEVRTGPSTPKSRRAGNSMGWIVVDGWDYGDPLSAKILDVADYYVRVLP